MHLKTLNRDCLKASLKMRYNVGFVNVLRTVIVRLTTCGHFPRSVVWSMSVISCK